MAKKVGGGGAIMQPYDENGEYDFNGSEPVERNKNFTPKTKASNNNITQDISLTNKIKTPQFVKTRKEAEDYLTNKLGLKVDTSVRNIDDELFVSNANKLIELDLNYNAISTFDSVTISSNYAKAIASVSNSSGCEVYNLNFSTKYYNDKQKYIDSIIKDRDIGRTVDFSDDYAEYAVLTHEYGHIIQNSLLKKQGFLQRVKDIIADNQSKYNIIDAVKKSKQQVRKEKREICTQIKKDILAIADRISKEEGLEIKMSTYGSDASMPGEFFAEAFLNSQGGKPNAIGKAILEYLKTGVK